jgi:3-dehydroquinate dehydratase-1
MENVRFQLQNRQTYVVGSFGSVKDLQKTARFSVLESCDIAEIRLDLLVAEGTDIHSKPWKHLTPSPLLFTARRIEEGGGLALDAKARIALLLEVLDDCALIDTEVASIPEMKPLLEELARLRIPWIASYHDFKQLPPPATLLDAAEQAASAGAAAFKVAARLHSPADLARLADFQLADHAIPVATMGMGPLAAVSRLLCAQSGSVLNYGYLGETSTAPGQWDSAFLKLAISRLVPFEAQEF